MKFLVDAHLPPGLCALMQAAGHDALHTRGLPDGNQTPDETINALSLKDERVVVSKDTDFYYSHLLHGKPWKLLLVRTGNLSPRITPGAARQAPCEVAQERPIELPGVELLDRERFRPATFMAAQPQILEGERLHQFGVRERGVLPSRGGEIQRARNRPLPVPEAAGLR